MVPEPPPPSFRVAGRPKRTHCWLTRLTAARTLSVRSDIANWLGLFVTRQDGAGAAAALISGCGTAEAHPLLADSIDGSEDLIGPIGYSELAWPFRNPSGWCRSRRRPHFGLRDGRSAPTAG